MTLNISTVKIGSHRSLPSAPASPEKGQLNGTPVWLNSNRAGGHQQTTPAARETAFKIGDRAKAHIQSGDDSKVGGWKATPREVVAKPEVARTSNTMTETERLKMVGEKANSIANILFGLRTDFVENLSRITNGLFFGDSNKKAYRDINLFLNGMSLDDVHLASVMIGKTAQDVLKLDKQNFIAKLAKSAEKVFQNNNQSADHKLKIDLLAKSFSDSNPTSERPVLLASVPEDKRQPKFDITESSITLKVPEN